MEDSTEPISAAQSALVDHWPDFHAVKIITIHDLWLKHFFTSNAVTLKSSSPSIVFVVLFVGLLSNKERNSGHSVLLGYIF